MVRWPHYFAHASTSARSKGPNQPIPAALSALLLVRTRRAGAVSRLGVLSLALINWLDTRPNQHEEAMLVSYNNKFDDLLTIAYPRCEVAETLQGGYCKLSGKVGFKGLVLCERHARVLEAQDRMALLEGIVSSLGLCLRSIPLRKNKDLSMFVRAQRAQATRELSHAREDLRRATQEECSS